MKDKKELPKEWKWVKLGEACEIVSGNTPKGLELISNKGEYQFYKVSDMNLAGNEIRMNVSNLKLTIEEIKKLKVKVYPKGSVIFPKRGGAILTNKKRILSQDASFDLNVMGILPNDKVSSNYLFYWIQKLDLSKIYDGSNVPQINNKNVAPLDFPLPPKPTQLAIVSKIEELFSELDKGIENLRMAQQQLKTYRQSVLKWAFEGKLTNENVKEGELSEGWDLSNLGELKQFSLYGPRFSSKDYTENGVAVLRTTDISERGKVDWENSPKLNLSSAEYEKYKLLKNDLLITRTGSIGRLSIFNDTKQAIPGAFLIHYRLVKDLNVWYIFHFLKSQKAQKHFSEHSFGVGRPNLNVPNIELLQIPIPSTEEQNKIVQEIESRFSVADKMEESITQSLQQAEALRQSILKKAFEGRLV